MPLPGCCGVRRWPPPAKLDTRCRPRLGRVTPRAWNLQPGLGLTLATITTHLARADKHQRNAEGRSELIISDSTVSISLSSDLPD